MYPGETVGPGPSWTLLEGSGTRDQERDDSG